MSQGVTTIIYPVRDLARAKALFGAWLDAEPYVDQPYYVGFRPGGPEIGLDPNGHAAGMTRPVAYLDIDDIRQRLQTLVDAGAETVQAVRDVGGGMLIASVRDAEGNIIGLRQAP